IDFLQNLGEISFCLENSALDHQTTIRNYRCCWKICEPRSGKVDPFPSFSLENTSVGDQGFTPVRRGKAGVLQADLQQSGRFVVIMLVVGCRESERMAKDGKKGSVLHSDSRR